MSIARGQITIVDLNDAKSLHMYLSSNLALTQIYNIENKSYVPDYSVSPYLVITPELYVSGSTANVINSLKGAPTWTINGSTTLTDYSATVASTSPWALTIKSNITTANQMKIECAGVFTDPDTQQDLTIKSVISFGKNTNAGQLCCAIAYAPNGTIFKNDQTSTLKAHCDLWRGSAIDSSYVSYQWYKLKTDGSWETLASSNSYGITNTTTNEITIPASAVMNFESFKCVITDTDSNSGTSGTSFSDIISFSDLSDPYVVDISSSTGDKLLNGVGSTVLTAGVWQNGNKFSDSAATTKFTFTWYKYNSDGSEDTSWGTDTTNHTKSGSVITVTAAEITNKATYVCYLAYI